MFWWLLASYRWQHREHVLMLPHMGYATVSFLWLVCNFTLIHSSNLWNACRTVVLTCTNLAFVNCIRILIILVIFFTHQVFKSTMLVLFYMSGSVGSLWFIFWIVFIFDTPSSHPRISSSEREFIESNTATIDKSVSYVILVQRVQTCLYKCVTFCVYVWIPY